MIRRILNRSKDLLFIAPFDRFRIGAMRGKVTCFLYHRVGESHEFLDRGGPPIIVAELERDLQLLRGLRAIFLTFEDLRNGRFPTADEIGAIICFDDCFGGNYTIGAPLLERLGIRATFFQVTSLIDSDRLLWEHALYWHTRDDTHAKRFAELARQFFDVPPDPVEFLRECVAPDRLEPLLDAAGPAEEMSDMARALYPTSEQLRQARRQGHEIGSHGHRHFKRANIDADVFESELATSSAAIEAAIGEMPRAFSYPFNSYQPGDDAICARYFSQAATVDKQRIDRDSNPLWLPRYTWPGPSKNALRRRRWLLTGTI